MYARLAALAGEELPLPGAGATPERHRRLFAVAREDVSLAKLAEAHWDAQAILAEAGRTPAPGALYAVWASEVPGREVMLERAADGFVLRGTKGFSSGAGLVDRALVTVASPEPRLIEVDLRAAGARVSADTSAWQTEAFRLTQTGGGNVCGGSVAGELPGWTGGLVP